MADSLRGGIVINEILADPNGASNFDTDGNGTAASTDEYIEIFNTSVQPVDLSGLELWDSGVGKWFTFPSGATLPPGGRAMVITGVQAGGSLPTGQPGDLFFDAGRGGAVINNGSDNVILLDPSSNTFVQATFNGDSLDDPTAGASGYAGFPADATRIGTGEDFGTDEDGLSLQRTTDGGDNFTTATPTPGGPNTCFARGALIDTPSGPVKVEELKVGDIVLTVDHGRKPIRWISSKFWSAAALAANSKLAPVRIPKGALGDGLPSADLIVSRQHRILVTGSIARRMFDAAEVLIPAKSLLDVSGVDLIFPDEGVTYHHIMLDQHELIYANGAPTESLYLGPMSIATIPEAAREEIEMILQLSPGAIELGDHIMRPARPLVEGRKAERLVTRHIKNSRSFVAELS